VRNLTVFLLAAAAVIEPLQAANITVTAGTTTIGSGGSAVTSADIVTVNGGNLEVSSNSTFGGLSGTGGQVTAGFQNSSYNEATLTLDVAAGASYVYNGTLRPNHYDGNTVNALRLVKNGDGTQELAGVLTGYIISPGSSASLFNRPTMSINAGVLKLSGAWGFDTYVDYGSAGAAVNVNAGGTLEVARNWSYGSGNAFNQLSENASNISVNGGTLRFTSVNQNSNRSFTVGSNGAVLSVASGLTFTSTGAIKGSSAGSLTLRGGSTSASLAAAVGGTGTWASTSKLIKTDSGTWTLSGGIASAFAAGVEVQQGSLVLTASSAYTASTLISSGGTLELRSTLVSGNYAGGITNNGLLLFNSTSNQTFSGVISGAGILEKKNSGVLTLTAANTFAGNIIVTSGTLGLSNAKAIEFSTLTKSAGSGSITFNIAGGTYRVGALDGAGSIVLSDSAATPGAITLETGYKNQSENFSGVLSGLGRLRKVGTNTLNLSGVNTYAGETIISSGEVVLSGSGKLGAGTVQLNGGSLNLSSSSVTFTNNVNLNGGVLTGGSMEAAQIALAQSGTVSTTLTGTGGLTKSGSTLLVLGAGVTHTYSGSTQVNGGILQVDGAIASNVTVASGAELRGHGTIQGDVSLNSGSKIAAGGSVGHLSLNGLTFAAGTQVTWDVYDANGIAGVGYDLITVAGALDLSGLSTANKASLVLRSLADPLDNFSGNAGLFDRTANKTFSLFNYGSLNLGSNTNIDSLFTIDKSNLRDGAGVLVDGDFSLSDSGHSIDLVYTAPIPEPSTYGLALGLLTLAAVAVRRRRSQSVKPQA
jgi:MYXO-CTERM domain-containing protein